MKKTYLLLLIMIVALAYAQSNTKVEDYLDMPVKISENTTVKEIDDKIILEKDNKTIEIEKTNEIYLDVFPENCSKLGFVFMQGHGYNYLEETAKFTNNRGWALGIAYSAEGKFNTAEMSMFVDESLKNNLIPIIRIMGENLYEEKVEPEKVAEFVNTINNNEHKLTYLQLWDKPNLVVEENSVFASPEDYADYVEAVDKVLDEDIMIISASLSLGESAELGENYRYDSTVYLSDLFDENEFWEAIDYWGSSAYNSDFTGQKYCVVAEEIEFYKGQNLCLDSVYGYRGELEKIKLATGYEFKTILTEIGYPIEENIPKTRELLQIVKSDPNVLSAQLFIANGWDHWQSSSWFDKDTKELKQFAVNLSQDLCSY